jgi:hypothetical protein
MMNFDTILGIDAGLSNGGIAIYRKGTPVKAIRMPKSFDDICEVLRYYKSISSNPIAFIEQVQLYKEDNFGKQFGIMKMLNNLKECQNACSGLGIPFIKVFPITWQTYLGLRRPDDKDKHDRKDRYKEAAQGYFKEIKVTLWNADALLLIVFGLKKIQFEPGWVIENMPKKTQKLI